MIDTLGELPAFFGLAEVAFVGGSLQEIGGHNVLEPAAAAVPVVTGPHLHNFAEISASLKEAGALQVVASGDELVDALDALLADDAARNRMGEAGRQLVASGRGALEATLQAIGLRGDRA